MDSVKNRPAVFIPDNEPYLGRQLLLSFDEMISACLERNAVLAPRTHNAPLTDVQQMACCVIPQGISLALSIRELIRQGYLFGAHTLLRPLCERAMMLQYVHAFPAHIETWKAGWKHREAPSLGKMIEELQQQTGGELRWRGSSVTETMNALLHGRPESGMWNLVPLDGGRFGHAPSKILNRPELCDDVCAVALPMLVIIDSMMAAYFSD